MKRRILAILLTICMVATLLPTAFAANGATVTTVDEVGENTYWDPATEEFRIYNDYWQDIVTEQPDGYVVDSDNSKLTISSAEALAWFGKQVNSGNTFAGYTVEITQDIDMSGHYWTPIDTATIKWVKNESTGAESWKTVNPQKKLDNVVITGGDAGHTITGIATASGVRGPNQPSQPGDGQNCYYYAAFIGRNDGTLTFKNLTFDKSNIAMTEPAAGISANGSSMCAALVALNTGSLTIDSVVVSNANILAMQKAAAYVAMSTEASSMTITKSEITNCNISAFFQLAPVCGEVWVKTNIVINGLKLENNTLKLIKSDAYGYTEDGEKIYWIYNGNSYLTACDTIIIQDTYAYAFAAEVNGYIYGTVEAAVAAAEDGDTVTLLADATSTVSIPADKKLTLDLNGHNITVTTGCAIVNKGNLTITGSGNVSTTATECAAIANFPGAVANVNGGTYTSDVWYVIKNMGEMVVDGPVTVKKPDGSTNTASLIDNGWVNSEDTVAGENVPAAADTAKLTIKNGSFEGKSGLKSCSVVKNDDYGILNISGGMFDSTNNTGTSNAANIMNWNVAEISGGTFIGSYPICNGKLNGGADEGVLKITGGNFTGVYSLLGENGGSVGGTLTIEGGYFKAPTIIDFQTEYAIEITGGYFTIDPSAYCPTGKTGVPSTEPGYAFTVGEDNTTTEVVAAAGKPDVDESKLDKALTDAQKTAITNAAASVTAQTGVLEAAAKQEAAKVEDKQVEAAKKQLEDSAVATTGATITVYAQTYLAVTPTKAAPSGSTYTSVTFDIQPMVRLVATTATSAADIQLEAEAGKPQNAVVLNGSEKELDTIQTMEISIELPTGFTDNTNTVYVQHKGYEYEATVAQDANGKYIATFTNPHGFSEFTITKDSISVAQIGETKYTRFEDALAAVQNGETIKLIGNIESTTAFPVSRNVTFTIAYNGMRKPTLAAGTGYTMTKVDGTGSATYTFSYVYTGTTPAQGLPFTDVSKDSPYYDGIRFVYEKGIMKGVTPTTFEPGTAVTRGMLVTLLYRNEGSPAVTGVSFSDVAAGRYFTDAVAWAAKNGIVTGFSDGTFRPDAPVSRQQLAVILFRYAGYKGMTAVTLEENLNGFTDESAISGYAISAMNWAVGQGLINGFSDGSVRPTEGANRAQTATVLMRLLQNVLG